VDEEEPAPTVGVRRTVIVYDIYGCLYDYVDLTDPLPPRILWNGKVYGRTTFIEYAERPAREIFDTTRSFRIPT